MSSATVVGHPNPAVTRSKSSSQYLIVGVDDAEVDRYGEALKAMNGAIQKKFGDRERVGFRSLVDLFDLNSGNDTAKSLGSIGLPGIDHFLETALTSEAELCRKILMAGCQSDRAAVRARIDEKDAAILALYRGFSKFMLEDLDRHPTTQKISRSQRRKLSTKVAFEMIMVHSQHLK
jgi:pyoverdine/dityrosine biosynthesis protein Dit1